MRAIRNRFFILFPCPSVFIRDLFFVVVTVAVMSFNFETLRDVQRISRVVNDSERNGPASLRRRGQIFPQPLPLIGVYNDSGSTIPPFGVVLRKAGQAQKSDTKLGPAQGICMSVKQPDTFGSQYNALVADEAQGAGYANASFGAVQMHPPFIALYDNADGTPAAGDAWGPRSGTFKLKKNTGGFRVIGVYDSTNFYALVWPEAMLSLKVKTTAAHNKGATQACDIWTGTEGAEVALGAGVVQATCYNRYANLASGKWARAAWNWDTQAMELVAGEC